MLLSAKNPTRRATRHGGERERGGEQHCTAPLQRPHALPKVAGQSIVENAIVAAGVALSDALRPHRRHHANCSRPSKYVQTTSLHSKQKRLRRAAVMPR